MLKVWIAAASQVTFSLSVAFGSILGYASFNKFKSNYLRYAIDYITRSKKKTYGLSIFRDCMIVTVCDCFTSVNNFEGHVGDKGHVLIAGVCWICCFFDSWLYVIQNRITS